MSEKRCLVFVAALVLVALAANVGIAAAQDPAMQKGVKGEMLMWIGDAEDKLMQLADAIPEAKYGWRPGDGVRSVGEVFMHVAAANFGIPTFTGAQAPAGFDFMSYEKSLTKKADIQKALKDSFAHAKKAFVAASDADLDKPVEMFGMKTTARGAYMLVLAHAHEHLGQEIGYARMNGVVPPWSVKQQQAEKAATEKKKGAPSS